MKIYNHKEIFAGLAVFVVLVLTPVFYNMGKAAPVPQPKIDTPAIQALAQKQCVYPKDEMRTAHMQLLNDWRTEVVRNNNRVFVAPDGKKYNMSLQNECMRCHSNKTQFCDQCHNYAGLATNSVPYCWTCHVAPKEAK